MKVRLVLVPPQQGAPPQTFHDSVASYQELASRAQNKWEATVAGSSSQSCRLVATSSSTQHQPLFVVDSEAAFQRLERLYAEARVSDAARHADRTHRVRLELREEEQDQQSPKRADLGASLASSRCSTPQGPASTDDVSPRTPSPPAQQQQQQQLWDEAALLTSIKKSVASWHQSWRLQHHLAA